MSDRNFQEGDDKEVYTYGGIKGKKEQIMTETYFYNFTHLFVESVMDFQGCEGKGKGGKI